MATDAIAGTTNWLGAKDDAEHIDVVIYDMTAAATHKKQLEAAQASR